MNIAGLACALGVASCLVVLATPADALTMREKRVAAEGVRISLSGFRGDRQLLRSQLLDTGRRAEQSVIRNRIRSLRRILRSRHKMIREILEDVSPS